MWIYFTFLLLSLSGLDLVPLSKDIDIPDDLDHNSIIYGDGEDIDLSSLGPDAYGTPNNDSGDALSKWSESSLMNPEEMGSYGQGDILMPSQHARNGMKDKTSRWPNGIIPYSIDGRFTQEQRDTIMKAIADYHRLTCLRFVPYSGQADYISITSANTGCWSSVGRIGSRQEVNLQAPGCLSKKGTVLHEILHAVGFTHEQSRPERDDYVTIHYNNVKPGSENNFKKSDTSYTTGYGVPYDYNSVMHYSEYAFSRNSKKTIEPKVGGVKLGQREGLSRGDVRKVNAMYNCKKQNGILTTIELFELPIFRHSMRHGHGLTAQLDCQPMTMAHVVPIYRELKQLNRGNLKPDGCQKYGKTFSVAMTKVLTELKKKLEE